MGIKTDISHFFALMKYILDNIDDRQISMMTSFRKKISNTFILARLCHEIVQYDKIPLRYVQVICVVDIVGNTLINPICTGGAHKERTRSAQGAHSPREISPIGFAALCTSRNDARKRMLHDCNSVHCKSLLPKFTSSICVDNLLCGEGDYSHLQTFYRRCRIHETCLLLKSQSKMI